MKEKVKIWSRRRLLGAFLAFLGLSAVATAQNGTVNANCSMTPVQTITRTIQQLNDSTYGTAVKLNFGSALAGYRVFVVAETNGSLTNMNGACSGLGDELTLLGATPDGYNPLAVDGDGNPVTYTFNYSTPGGELGYGNEVTTVDGNGFARINIKSGTAVPTPTNDIDGYYFGVFLQDPGTGCFSDVQVIKIQVITNIYATMTLAANGTAHEYICSGTTTKTNIGFTLCNLPESIDAETGRLTYTAKATNNAVTSAIIKGSKVWADETAENGHSGYGNYSIVDGVATASTIDWDGENGISTVSNAVIPNVVGDATHKYLVRLGTQTLTNTVDGTNPGTTVAGTVVYTFENMVYTYYVGGRRVDVPVVFDVNNQCGNGNSPTEFTVHVAPDFKVQALAYKEGERPESVTGGYMDGTGFVTGGAEAPTFCQGLDAYLHTEYSTTEGSITSYTWSQVTPSDARQQLTIANTTDRAPVTSDLTQLAYTLNVATLWNDAETNGNYGTGCPANDEITITITEAPKLLVQATNSTFTHDGDVCPGTPINISAQDGPLAADQTTITAENILSTGNGIIIDHNGANFSYIIGTSGTDLKVFDTWRATQVTEGNLPVVSDFFDNEDNVDPAGDGTITYTIQTITTGQGVGTNVCPLVNFDGTALTETTTVDGNTTTTVTNAVKAVYTVSPRPQFILGAN